MLIFSSCTKEQTQTNNYQVEEYFAENKQEVREKVYTFLLAADRLGIAAKDSVVFTNKDPNEGSWLMEAAANAEKVGNLDKTTVESKIITLEIQNELNASGEIEMKASDILLKYNSLLAEIEANEINGKNAQLIDFKVESVDPSLTKIRTEVLFGKVNPDEILPDSLPGGGGINNSLQCSYSYLGLYSNPINNNWTQNFGFPLIYPNGIYSAALSQNTESFIGTFGWYFNSVASNSIYYKPPVPIGSIGLVIDGSDQGYTPYTNIILVEHTEIETVLSCSNIINKFDYTLLDDLGWDNELDTYAEMLYVIENQLPNSLYREYRPAYGKISSGKSTKGYKITLERVGYLYENNL